MQFYKKEVFLTKIDGSEIPKKVLAKAIACETPEELVKLAKECGVELTTEEAQAYLDELDDVDITSAQLRVVAGGVCKIRNPEKKEW